MKHLAVLTLLLAFHSPRVFGQPASRIRADELVKEMSAATARVKVYNFWATWCGPCIKEIPFFEKLGTSHPDVSVTLVSLDLDLDPDPAKVYKFMERKKIKSRVIMLDERDPNSYIEKIDKRWSGALPATLIVNTATGKRLFVQQELKEGDLEKMIAEIM
jgi:thiol-disulfide isomerase/thioredoxin